MTSIIKVNILPVPPPLSLIIILETFINAKNNPFTDLLFLLVLLLFKLAQEIFIVEILCHGVQKLF